MKVFKYYEYLKENVNDVPEQYVEDALRKLKTKFEKMFSYDIVDNGEIKKFGEAPEEKSGMSLRDLNLELQSCEFSKYSKVFDNLRVKFTDERYLYDLLITIDLKDAVPTNPDEDFSDEKIEKCFVKFKKYDNESFELLGQLSKTAEIKKINEDFLMELKLDIDKEYGEEEEEFEIETEEEEEKPKETEEEE
jgi:hypothetical protein